MSEETVVAHRYLRTPVVEGKSQVEFGLIAILIMMVAFIVCICFSSWYSSRQKALEGSKVIHEDEEKRCAIRSALQAKQVVMVSVEQESCWQQTLPSNQFLTLGRNF
jgi:hypothetical protein